MKAAWYERNGPADEVLVVGEMPDPVAGPNEVVVQLATSGVNPSDVKSREGRTRKLAFPRQVPQSDGAGTVVAVGPGVPASRVGTKVWVFNGAWQRPMGTAAQYIALPADLAVPLPDGLDFAQGACLGIPAMTAHRCVFADGSVAGKSVLVAGGAGVVGHYAVQLARWAGAHVIATVSSEAKARHALAGGAHATVDYKRENAAEKIMDLTRGRGVDRIVEVEFGDNMALNLQAIAPDGTIAYYGSVSGEAKLPFFASCTKNVTLRAVLMYTLSPEARRRSHLDLAAWTVTGKPHFAVAERFPLAEIAAAHRCVEAAAKIGHVVVDI